MLTLDRHGCRTRATSNAGTGEPCVGFASTAATPLHFVGGHLGLHGYVLTREALARLVASNLHVDMLGFDATMQSLAGLGLGGTESETKAIANYIGNHGNLVVVGPNANHTASDALCTRLDHGAGAKGGPTQHGPAWWWANTACAGLALLLAASGAGN